MADDLVERLREWAEHLQPNGPLRNDIEEAIARLSAEDGMVRVPMEPTEAMLKAMRGAELEWLKSDSMEGCERYVYRAMIAAAPAEGRTENLAEPAIRLPCDGEIHYPLKAVEGMIHDAKGDEVDLPVVKVVDALNELAKRRAEQNAAPQEEAAGNAGTTERSPAGAAPHSRTVAKRIAVQQGEPIPRFDAPAEDGVCEWTQSRTGLWWPNKLCGCGAEIHPPQTCPGCRKRVAVKGGSDG